MSRAPRSERPTMAATSPRLTDPNRISASSRGWVDAGSFCSSSTYRDGQAPRSSCTWRHSRPRLTFGVSPPPRRDA